MSRLFSLFILCLAALSVLPLKAYEVDPEILATGLRTVVIETIDGEEPTCEPIYAPPGSWGVGITDVNKVPGSVAILNADGSVAFESGEYSKKESGMTVKVRGNTSALYAKKPYKIKLEKKGDLLTRGDKNLNDKNWVLLTNRSNLYELGFLIGQWVGMPYVPQYEYVNVVLNGDYRGLYVLAESVERNDKCRIITEESGFIAEKDPYWWNENGEYLPSIWNPQFNWTMKYPDFEDLTEEQKTYIQSVLDDFEAIISTEDYESLIDIDTFCRWLIAQDILGTSDGGGTNFYLAKYNDQPDTKLYVPVLWDVDSGEETVDAWSNVHNEAMIKPLWNNSNTAFKRRYIQLYWEVAATIFNNIEDLEESMYTDLWVDFNKAVELNNQKWGEENMNSSSWNAGDMEMWFTPRRQWLDQTVSNLEISLGIDGVICPEMPASITVHSLDGIKIYSGNPENFTSPNPGIYIVSDGRSIKKMIF